MTVEETIRALLKSHGRRQVWLAEQMGYASAGGVSQILQRGNITIGTLLRICELFDYELTIQPKRIPGKRPEGQFVIDATKKED